MSLILTIKWVTLSVTHFFETWPIFPSVTHYFKCDTFSKCDPFCKCYTYSKCEKFLQLWPTFSCVTHSSSFDPCHASKCNPFWKCFALFPNMTHFSEVGPIFLMWAIFPSVTHLSKLDPIVSPIVTNFFKSDLFFSVTHLSKCDPTFQSAQFLQMSLICFKKGPIFQSLTHSLSLTQFC